MSTKICVAEDVSPVTLPARFHLLYHACVGGTPPVPQTPSIEHDVESPCTHEGKTSSSLRLPILEGSTGYTLHLPCPHYVSPCRP